MSRGDAGGAEKTPAQWVLEAESAVRASDMVRAMELAEQALRSGAVHPLLLNLRAFSLEQQGFAEQALGHLERARALAPEDPFVHNAIGECYLRLARYAEAVAAAEAALKLSPAFPRAAFTKGLAYEMLGELDAAEFCFRQVIQLDPNFADAFARLSAIASRRSDWKTCRELAGRALAIDRRNSIALFTLATADIVLDAPADAEARLRLVLDDAQMNAHERANALSMLGDVRDRQDRIDEAFGLYETANSELRAYFAPTFGTPKPESPLEQISRLTNYFRDRPGEAWSRPFDLPRAPDDSSRGLIFLVGFPRSGTTLLGQILASHPDAVTLEEKAPMVDAIREFYDDPAGLERLARLGPEEISRYRNAYWGHVRKFGVHMRDKLLVDKQPLNIFRLPLITRIFPDAKIVLAVRDPRDVVFSCFRRLFNMHPFTYQLLTLSGTAETYTAAMRLLEIYRAILPLDLCEIRNEDVIEDFEGQIGTLCRFAGLEWRKSMRSFAADSKRRQIATPSATQIAKGLTAEGVGQWRRYKEHLAPVLPMLRPWVEKFGYPSE